MKNKTAARTSKPFWITLILILVFLIPLTGAWILFKDHDTLGKTTNRGHLVKPPFSINALNVKATKGRWMLIVLDAGQCNRYCASNLDEISRIWLATGKERMRVQRAIISFQNAPDNDQIAKLVKQRFPKVKHLVTAKSSFTAKIRKEIGNSEALKTGSIYIVDPHGNVMMYYTPSQKATAVFKDLTRLLKVSQIG